MKKTNGDYVYKKGVIKRLPVAFKALFIKAWFAGAVFYFIGWGTQALHSSDQLDLALSLGLALGLVTDIIVNRILVHLDSAKREYSKYAFFYSKKFYSLPVNLFLYVIISLLIALTYNFINIMYIRVNELPQTYVFLGAEPLLYAIFFLVYDTMFLGIKKVFKVLFKRRKQNEIS